MENSNYCLIDVGLERLQISVMSLKDIWILTINFLAHVLLKKKKTSCICMYLNIKSREIDGLDYIIFSKKILVVNSSSKFGGGVNQFGRWRVAFIHTFWFEHILLHQISKRYKTNQGLIQWLSTNCDKIRKCSNFHLYHTLATYTSISNWYTWCTTWLGQKLTKG